MCFNNKRLDVIFPEIWVSVFSANDKESPTPCCHLCLSNNLHVYTLKIPFSKTLNSSYHTCYIYIWHPSNPSHFIPPWYIHAHTTYMSTQRSSFMHSLLHTTHKIIIFHLLITHTAWTHLSPSLHPAKFTYNFLLFNWTYPLNKLQMLLFHTTIYQNQSICT